MGNFLEQFTDINLPLHGVRLPEFKLEEEDRLRLDIAENTPNDKILEIIARHGYVEKMQAGLIDKSRAKEYGERARYELSVLKKTQFADYILLVWDVMNYVRKNNLAHGCARGSGGGSLINYLIGITEIDPIIHGLFFERFISESRAKINIVDSVTYLDGIPDIDADFGQADRDFLLKHLYSKYQNKIVKLSTVNTLTTKVLIKDVGKIAGGFDESEMNHITDLIPVIFGKVHTPQRAYEEVEKFKEFCDKNPLIYKIACKLYGLIKSTGSHASAYLVSRENLDEFMPCQLGTDDEIVSSYDMHIAEKLAIKLDLLGVNTISLVYNTAKMVGVNLNDIDLNDYDKIYSHLQNLECPYGLFQISGYAAVKGLNQIKPKSLEHLSGVLAICRPGALSFLEQYANYVNTGESVSLNPLFDDIFKFTGGICLYQESLMAAIVKLGFTLQDADTIRRIVGKKKVEEVKLWEEKIYQKAKENDIDFNAAKVVWDVANASASYSFNKCLDVNSLVIKKGVGNIKIKNIKIGDEVLCFDTVNKFDRYFKVKNIYKNNKKCFEFLFASGRKITCSLEHKFLCFEAWKQLSIVSIFLNQYSVVSKHGTDKVVSARYIGKIPTLDLEINSGDHNFYCNGLVVSNSHSVAYSVVAAWSVYLKFNYPQQFFLEAIKMSQNKSDFTKEISQIQQELPKFGIQLLAPDLVKSEMDFTLEGRNIRYGLSAIKGISNHTIDKLRSFIDREKANKFDVFQAAKLSKLNIGALCSLIQSGCLSSYGEDRPRMVLEAQVWNILSDSEKVFFMHNGHIYDFNVIDMLRKFDQLINSKGKRVIKDSRMETIRKKCLGYFDIYSKNSKHPRLASFFYEKKLLGYSYSETLRNIFIKDQPDLENIDKIKMDSSVGSTVHLAAEVVECYKKKSQNGKNYMRMLLQDESGSISALLFGDDCDRYFRNGGEEFKENDIIYLRGQLGDDRNTIWIRSCEAQHVKIYLKLSELKQTKNEEE